MEEVQSGWRWPSEPLDNPEPPTSAEPSSAAASGNDYPQSQSQSQSQPQSQTQSQEPQPSQGDARKHARMCWICREEVLPTYEEPGFLGSVRNRRPKRRYVCEDGDRFISPCQCKGSIKWVHENCLKTWMNESANGYKCSQCGYVYQMERLNWAQTVRSPILALTLTAAILIVTIFLLGFIANPVLGLWLDPLGTIADTVTSGASIIDEVDPYDEDDGWVEHFLKGTFALGLLGFAKAFVAMSPWQWWNLRTSGIVGGGGGVRRGGTGRERLENVNLALVIIGVFTFLYTVWKATRKWTERTLDRASQRILNVRRDDDEDDDDVGDDEETEAKRNAQ